MSGELVERLRQWAGQMKFAKGGGDLRLSLFAAADCIEALEAELAQARNDAASADAAKDEWVLRFHAADAELARIHAVMAEVDSEVDPLDEELADLRAENADLRAQLRDVNGVPGTWGQIR